MDFVDRLRTHSGVLDLLFVCVRQCGDSPHLGFIHLQTPLFLHRLAQWKKRTVSQVNVHLHSDFEDVERMDKHPEGRQIQLVWKRWQIRQQF